MYLEIMNLKAKKKLVRAAKAILAGRIVFFLLWFIKNPPKIKKMKAGISKPLSVSLPPEKINAKKRENKGIIAPTTGTIRETSKSLIDL